MSNSEPILRFNGYTPSGIPLYTGQIALGVFAALDSLRLILYMRVTRTQRYIPVFTQDYKLRIESPRGVAYITDSFIRDDRTHGSMASYGVSVHNIPFTYTCVVMRVARIT